MDLFENFLSVRYFTVGGAENHITEIIEISRWRRCGMILPYRERNIWRTIYPDIGFYKEVLRLKIKNC